MSHFGSFTLQRVWTGLLPVMRAIICSAFLNSSGALPIPMFTVTFSMKILRIEFSFSINKTFSIFFTLFLFPASAFLQQKHFPRLSGIHFLPSASALLTFLFLLFLQAHLLFPLSRLILLP